MQKTAPSGNRSGYDPVTESGNPKRSRAPEDAGGDDCFKRSLWERVARFKDAGKNSHAGDELLAVKRGPRWIAGVGK